MYFGPVVVVKNISLTYFPDKEERDSAYRNRRKQYYCPVTDIKLLDAKKQGKYSNAIVAWACDNNAVDIVKKYIKEEDYWTAVYFACNSGSLQVLQYLGSIVDKEQLQEGLEYACDTDINCTKYLLSKGCKINKSVMETCVYCSYKNRTVDYVIDQCQDYYDKLMPIALQRNKVTAYKLYNKGYMGKDFTTRLDKSISLYNKLSAL